MNYSIQSLKLNLTKNNFGLYTGKEGIILSGLKIAELANSNELLKEIEAIKNLDDFPYYSKELEFDIMSGISGRIIYLIRLFEREKNNKYLDEGLKLFKTLIKMGNITNETIFMGKFK